jgi:uncharacterized membrane protein
MGAPGQQTADRPPRARWRSVDRPWLWALVLGGALVRLVGAFRYPGVQYDIESLRLVGQRFVDDPLHLYESMRWPYGPVYLPVTALAEQVAQRTGHAFDGVVKLPLVVADAVSTWLVADVLRRRGASTGCQVAAAALVALGPVSLVVVVAHGQIDPFAFCLVLAALWVWQRGGASRALWCGVLIGLAAATKTTPLFCLLAFLPVCRSRADALRLVAPALLVPAVLLLPRALSEPGALRTALTSNGGVPGFGSWSLLLQPSLADLWIGREAVEPSAATLQVTELQNLIVLAPLIALAPLLWRWRLDPALATAAVFLTVQAANPNLSHQYLVWAVLPALAAGLVRQVAVLSAAFALPLWVLYFRPDNVLTSAGVYRALALTAWVVLVVVTVQVLLLARRRAETSARER